MLELSLDGSPLLLPDRDGIVNKSIERLIGTELYGMPTDPRSSWDPIIYPADPDQPSPLPIEPPNWPKAPKLRINQLYWPVTGASRFAYGYFLMRASDYDRIDTTQAVSLYAQDSQDLMLTEMFALQPRQLIYEPGIAEAIHVVPLVDERFFWQFIPFNRDGQPAETWKDVLDLLRPVIEKHETLEIADRAQSIFQGTSDEALLPHQSQLVHGWNTIGPVLDAMMASTGFRYVRTPDVSKIAQPPEVAWNAEEEVPETFEDSDDSEHSPRCETRIGGGEDRIRIPDKITLLYHEGQARKTITTDVPTNIGEDSPGKFTNDPEWEICFNSSLNTDDVAVANAYAAQLANRYWQWQHRQYDVHYPGLRTFHPNSDEDIRPGTLDCFLFNLGTITQFGEIGEKHQLTTRMVSLPPWVIGHQVLPEWPSGGEESSSSSGSSGSSDSDSESDDSDSDSDMLCAMIPGVNFEDLPVIAAGDANFVLGIQDGCLVRIELAGCDEEDGSQ